MLSSFKDFTIRRKFIVVAFVATITAMFVAILISTVMQWLMLREELVKNVSAQASIIALNSTASLVSDDRAAANKVLRSLSDIDNIEFAGILDKNGKEFALYVRPGTTMAFHRHKAAQAEDHMHDAAYVEITFPIIHNQEQVGLIHVRSDMSPVYSNLELNMLIIVVAAAGAFVIAVLILMRLLSTITDPLQHLVKLTQDVSQKNDFTLRAQLNSNDETGQLANGFNAMLTQLQIRDESLAQHRRHLEDKVNERTKELQKSNTQLEKELVVRKQTEETIRESEIRYRGVFEYADDIIYLLTPEGTFHSLNPAFERLTGWRSDEWVGSPFATIIHPDDLPRAVEIFENALAGHSTPLFELRIAKKSGDYFDSELSIVPVDPGGEIAAIGIARDVTERKRTEQALEESERKFRAILDSAVDGVLLMDKQKSRFIQANSAICEMLGYRPDELYNLGITDIHPEESLPEVFRQFERQTRGEIFVAQNLPVKRKDGSIFIADISSAPMTLSGRTIMVGFFHDVTERKRIEEKMQLLATTDSLTGIANRRAFMAQLDSEIERAHRYGTPLALVMYDIDYFKQINDNFGHDVGDSILQAITEVVKNNVRAVDTVARWGGEEFMILMPESDLSSACIVAEKLREEVAGHPFEQVNNLTVSFGVTDFKSNEDVDTLLKRVDDALYKAKENGRNSVAYL